jgi:hypothetical protein
MRKSLALLLITIVGSLTFLLASCQPVDYSPMSPVTITNSTAVTGFGDNTTNGATTISGSVVINVPNVATTAHVDYTKVTEVTVSVTIADYNWWIVIPFAPTVNGATPTWFTVNGATVNTGTTLAPYYLWNCNTGSPQFGGTRTFNVVVPYAGAGNVVLSAVNGLQYYGGLTAIGNIVIKF